MSLNLGSGCLGNLTSDEEQKLQASWVHLLRLCGIEKASLPQATPDLSDTLLPHLNDASPESFRRSFWSFILAEHPDALVLRFLRARKWDVEKAMVMLVSAMAWRDERNIEGTIIHTGEDVAFKDHPSADDKAFIAQYQSGKSYVRGTDKEHRPIYVIRVALHDPQLQSAEAMESYILHNIESIRILIKPPNDKCCLIFDMTGFGLRNMDFHVVKFLVSVFEARYPETLGLVLIHSAPFVFWGIWNIIKGWLDPVIASKIHFTRKKTDLLQFVSEDNLQTGYGGTDSWTYTYSEPVTGENARLKEEEKKAKIQEERSELIREFEQETVGWVSPQCQSSPDNKNESRRDQVTRQLGLNYWKLDPYIRARTYYHRVGVVDDKGEVDFKAAGHEK
ncbi:hypothetical protein JX265_010401 [Neoarthrinium moseri]|uniref:CRAL-TRIO domain-containing protein n=1 Tax=Neoarthrinium moseri TaxID=1658444 RepID=A0A9Q0ALN2_9PEZI|nr:uncharacterized protein JN550_012489 [Neoarthrinium moseri]KAI1858739.1 hypothetical protein JN550_012489 [Neoarthrinium moseri]KAI1859398.1 hypothetical protein JX265_010401 [Neoarthrinium moseri]